MSKSKNSVPKEYKQFEAIITSLDEQQGIVKAVFAVMGNVDEGNDRIWPGSFTKTFVERGHKILVLDNHKATSTLDTIAKPINLRELSRAELPAEVLSKFPSATGGAEITAQFEPDAAKDAISARAFYRLKRNWVTEWSFGYDPLDFDYSTERIGTKEVQVRNLRTLKLYEVSPCLWGMNQATMTTDAKGQNIKQWGIIPTGTEFCVFKLDEDGEPTNKLECFDTEAEADSHIQSLGSKMEDKPAPDVTENTVRIRVRDPGDFDENAFGQGEKFRTITIGKESEGIQATIGKLEGEASTTIQVYIFDKEKWTLAEAQKWVDEHKKGIAILMEQKVGRILAQRNANRILAAFNSLKEALDDAGVLSPEQGEDEETIGPPKSGLTPTSTEAGSQTDEGVPVEKYLKLIKIERLKSK